jgi:hypothetical protein
MYGFIWRHLPGPLALRIAIALVLLLAAVAVLFVWVFPALAPIMPFNNGTVNQ